MKLHIIRKCILLPSSAVKISALMQAILFSSLMHKKIFNTVNTGVGLGLAHTHNCCSGLVFFDKKCVYLDTECL